MSPILPHSQIGPRDRRAPRPQHASSYGRRRHQTRASPGCSSAGVDAGRPAEGPPRRGAASSGTRLLIRACNSAKRDEIDPAPRASHGEIRGGLAPGGEGGPRPSRRAPSRRAAHTRGPTRGPSQAPGIGVANDRGDGILARRPSPHCGDRAPPPSTRPRLVLLLSPRRAAAVAHRPPPSARRSTAPGASLDSRVPSPLPC